MISVIAPFVDVNSHNKEALVWNTIERYQAVVIFFNSFIPIYYLVKMRSINYNNENLKAFEKYATTTVANNLSIIL